MLQRGIKCHMVQLTRGIKRTLIRSETCRLVAEYRLKELMKIKTDGECQHFRKSTIGVWIKEIGCMAETLCMTQTTTATALWLTIIVLGYFILALHNLDIFNSIYSNFKDLLTLTIAMCSIPSSKDL